MKEASPVQCCRANLLRKQVLNDFGKVDWNGNQQDFINESE